MRDGARPGVRCGAAEWTALRASSRRCGGKAFITACRQRTWG